MHGNIRIFEGMRCSILLFALALSTFAFAQPNEVDDLNEGMTFGFTMESQWNADDFYLGFGMGVEHRDLDAGARLTYSFRPYFKKVLIKESATLAQQFHEKRFVISLDAEKRYTPYKIKKADFGVFANLKLGVVFGNYKGTNQKPEGGLLASPSIGPVFAWNKSVYLKFGYNFFPDRIESVQDSKVYMGLTIAFR